MAKVGNVIEINGKKYDAATGTLLKESAGGEAKTTKKSGGSVDGMRKAKTATTKRTAAHAPKTPQKSRTLRRSTVKKPAEKTKAKPASLSGITKSQLGVPKQRAQAAVHTKQSPLVSHFGSTQPSTPGITKKIQHMPVKKPAAQHKPAVKHATKPVAEAPTKKKHTTTATKVAQTAAAPVVKTRNVAAAKMIETALANATSHEQPAHHKTKRRHKVARKLGVSARAIAISSTVLAGVLLGGFFAAQNVPNLSMRVAAARAGFDATLPAYNPSGFSYNSPINYSAGQVTISFKSNTDNRQYDLTQRASNWNSEALLANYVAVNGQQYQAYEDRGRTLYIYDGANATWVDNGIWYQIEGESQMTPDQIIRVAASM